MAVIGDIANWIESKAPVNTKTELGIISYCKAFNNIEEIIASSFPPIRQYEFHTGRKLARIALSRFDHSPESIPCYKERDPLWPVGFLGSISHSRDLCAVAVCQATDVLGIGIDIEFCSAVQPSLKEIICRSDEMLPKNDCGELCLTLYFSAKEAFYKSYFPATRVFLEFHDVHVEIDVQRSEFLVLLTHPEKPSLLNRRSFHGYFHWFGNIVATAVWITRR